MQQKRIKWVHLGVLLTRQAMKIKLEPTAVDTRTPRGKDSLKKGHQFGPQFGAGMCAAILKWHPEAAKRGKSTCPERGPKKTPKRVNSGTPETVKTELPSTRERNFEFCIWTHKGTPKRAPVGTLKSSLDSQRAAQGDQKGPKKTSGGALFLGPYFGRPARPMEEYCFP